MNVHGTHQFDAPRERVFQAIRDPRMLMAVIPGCEDVRQVSPDRYEGRIGLRLPGASGSYRTEVVLSDVQEPEHARLSGRVDGSMGAIAGEAVFDLLPAGSGTRLEYSGSALIQGPLARLDSRFVEGIAKSLIGQGLNALDKRLSAEVVA